MNVRWSFSGPRRYYGLLGYLDVTLSAYRQWSGSMPGHPTWRHFTIALRSPVVLQPASSSRDGKRRFTWHRPRFGWLASNYYFGVIYIITTMRSSNLYGRDPYRKWGPLEWVWDDGKYRPGTAVRP